MVLSVHPSVVAHLKMNILYVRIMGTHLSRPVDWSQIIGIENEEFKIRSF